jgi:hypothetical protein
MKSMIIFLLFAMYVWLLGCNKTDNPEFTDSPIVESYLHSGDYPIVKITRQIPFSDNAVYSSDDINNLTIILSHNNDMNAMTPLGDGKYIDSTIIVSEGDKYEISFSFNSKNISAYTNVPAKPVNYTQSATSISIEKMDNTSGPPTMGTMPDPVSLKWDNNDGSYYIVVIENMSTTLVPIRDFGGNEPPGNRFRKPPTTSSGLELRPMEFQYYGKHRLILFHVLPDYASLYSENQTSSQNLTNPSTSILNGYGIFTGLNSDTLYLNVGQL